MKSFKSNLLFVLSLTGVFLGTLWAYTPTQEAESAHNIPPVADFANTFRYKSGILAFPLSLLVIGLLTIAGFHTFFVLFYGCSITEKHQRFIVWVEEKKLYRDFHIAFMVLSIVAMILTFIVFIGIADLKEIFENIADGMGFYVMKLQNAHKGASGVGQLSDGVKLLSNNAPCSTAMTLVNNIITNYTAYSSAIKVGSNKLGDNTDITEKLQNAQKLIREKAIPLVEADVYTLFCTSVGAITLLWTAYGLKHKGFFTVSIWGVELLVVGLIIISSIEMAIVHILGDVCMDPSAALTAVFGTSDTSDPNYGFVPYFTKCVGSSPSTTSFVQTYTPLAFLNGTHVGYFPTLNTTIVDALGQQNTCLLTISGYVGKMFQVMAAIRAGSGCSETRAVFEDVIEAQLCRDGLSKFYLIWLVHLFVAIILLFTLFCIGYFYDNFEYDTTNEDIFYDVAEVLCCLERPKTRTKQEPNSPPKPHHSRIYDTPRGGGKALLNNSGADSRPQSQRLHPVGPDGLMPPVEHPTGNITHHHQQQYEDASRSNSYADHHHPHHSTGSNSNGNQSLYNSQGRPTVGVGINAQKMQPNPDEETI